MDTCLVKREHCIDDTIGLNTIPEDIATGEYITDGAIEKIDGLSSTDISNICVAFATTYHPYYEKQYSSVQIYNKNVFACPVYFCKNTNLQNLKQDINVFIQKTNSDGHINDIQYAFYFPAYLLADSSLTSYTIQNEDNVSGTFYELPESNSPIYSTELFTRRNSFSDYTPKNNKLFCYPYNVLQVTNNNGVIKNYRFEDFENVVSGKVQFRFDCSLSVGGSSRIYPMNYKGKIYDLTEQLPLGKFPVINWASDTYTNYLTEQANNEIIKSQKSPLSAIGTSIGKMLSNIPRCSANK